MAIKILQILPSYSVKWGGPSKVVHDICIGLSQTFDLTILTTFKNPDDEILPVPEGVKYISFEVEKPLSSLWKSYSRDLDEWLEDNIRNFDLIHIHEMWHYSQFVASRKALRYGIPYMVSPHGELDSWRIKQKLIRKKIFGAIFQKKMLQNASIIHALTSHEEKSIRNFAGENVRISIIPNSISENGITEESEKIFSRPYILFLGRLQKVKGCFELLKAYTKWSGKTDYDLVFAGLFEDVDYEVKMKQWIEKNNLSDKVVFMGLVSGKLKNALLHQAALFILPSHSEGFPVAVLEAMKAGCPVIISRNTGINDLMGSRNAAIICDSTSESILEKLQEFQSLPKSNLNQMAFNASQLFKTHFAMETVLEKYIKTYHELGLKDSIRYAKV